MVKRRKREDPPIELKSVISTLSESQTSNKSEIPSDIPILKDIHVSKKIGSGAFVEVYLGDWHGNIFSVFNFKEQMFYLRNQRINRLLHTF